MGVGGQMALHLGFNNRDLFRGVAATGAVAIHPRDNVKDQRLAFYLAGGELDPLIDHIGKSAAKLLDMNYPGDVSQDRRPGPGVFAKARSCGKWRTGSIRWISSNDVYV